MSSQKEKEPKRKTYVLVDTAAHVETVDPPMAVSTVPTIAWTTLRVAHSTHKRTTTTIWGILTAGTVYAVSTLRKPMQF